LRNPYVVSSS